MPYSPNVEMYSGSRRVVVVFIVYGEVSIKSFKKSKRVSTSDGAQRRNVLPTYTTKLWNKLFSVTTDTADIATSLALQRKKEAFKCRIGNRIIPGITSKIDNGD